MRYNGNDLFGQQTKGVDNKKYIIFTIDEKEQLNPYNQYTIGHHGSMTENTTLTFYRPILCEYIDGMENWDWESIGYFTGTKNIGNEFMRIGNKNLFDGILENGMIDRPGTLLNAAGVSKRTVNFIKTKPNTSYTLSCDNGYNTLYIHEYDKDYQHIIEKNILYSNTFTTEQNTMYIKLNSHTSKELPSNTKIQLEEASSATAYVAHKHNSLHILPDKQIPLTFEQGATVFSTTTSFTEQINNTMTNRIRTGLLDLEPNETYRISCGDKNYIQATAFYNNSNIGAYTLGSDSNDYVFTTTKDVHKICINIAKSDMDENITQSVLHQVRLEKVTDVTLRSVGNVKDELDLTRGVYIQRMYEVKLNGFEDWSIHNEYSTDNHLCFYWGYKKIPSYDHNKFGQWYCAMNVTPLLIPRGWNSFYGAKTDEEGVAFNGDNKQNIAIKIRKDRLSSQDANGFKQWLQSNPITVQYPLETPIEHKINIPMKNELNQTIAKPNNIFTLPLMHSETNHVDINSQIYPKVQSRDYISYPVIANNSQLHTVFHNKLGTGNLTVNLCGTSVTSVDGTSKCTITTPSTISQYELRLSGARNKVSNVCVFSGDYMNVNVPYMQGMMNAVNPIVKNVGKNLFDGELEMGSIYLNNGVNYDSIRTIRTKNFIPIKSSTQYILKNDKNYAQNIIFYDEQQRAISYYSDTIVFTTPVNTKYLKFRCAEHLEQKDLHTKFQLEEGSVSTPYIEYKENICYVDCGEIRLTPDMFEQGSVNNTGNSYESDKNDAQTRVRTKDLIELEPNVQYVILGDDSKYKYSAHFYDKDGMQVKGSYDLSWKANVPFTVPSDAPMIAIFIAYKDNKKITPNDVDAFNFHLVKASEIITLRSLPNGVRDELNLQTGEYIQRIGEINVRELSKMDNMVIKGRWDNGAYMSFDIITPDAVKDKINVITTTSNLFQTVIRNLEGSNSMKEFVTNTASGNLFVMIRKDRLISSDLNGFKQWLEDNDLVIQYQLATPIVKQVDINNFPHSYKDGHIIIGSNDPSTNVTAQMTYQCVANRTGQIQEHTEQVEKQEHEINELEMLILENIRQQQNR